jgi:hypothetical protein
VLRAPALRYDPFKPELAGMGEHDRALVLVEMFS